MNLYRFTACLLSITLGLSACAQSATVPHPTPTPIPPTRTPEPSPTPKPEERIVEDGTGDGTSCARQDPLEGLDSAADLRSAEAFSSGDNLVLDLTFVAEDLASAVAALPEGEWGVTVHLLHDGLPAPEADQDHPLASLQNEIVRITFNHGTQQFLTQRATFTDGQWVGASPLGTGAIPMGENLQVILPGALVDDNPALFLDAVANGVCDNVPDAVTGDSDFMEGIPYPDYAIGPDFFSDLVYPDYIIGPGSDDLAGDGLACGTGEPLEGLVQEADLIQLQVFTNNSTAIFELTFPEAADLAAAAAASADPVRVGLSFVHPEGVQPIVDPNAVFATSQNEFYRVTFNPQTQNYEVAVQILGEGGWIYTPALGTGAAAHANVLEIVRPTAGITVGTRMYAATFTNTACDAIGFEDGQATLSILED